MDWFQIGKGVHQGCILSPCLFNLYVSYEKPGWMKHNLESRLLGEISITSDMQMKKRKLELDMEQWTGSKLGKEYIQAVYCHPAYSTYMQSTSCKMPAGWSTSWNQDCREKYQLPQIWRWHHPYGRKRRGTKEPLDEGEKGLKLNIQKTKTMASGPISWWQIDGETMETVTDFIFLSSKVTADGDCSHENKRCLLF